MDDMSIYLAAEIERFLKKVEGQSHFELLSLVFDEEDNEGYAVEIRGACDDYSFFAYFGRGDDYILEAR